MHFTLNGDEYRLGFRYTVETETHTEIGKTQDRTLTITETWNKHTATAVVWVKRPGGPRQAPEKEWHWEVFDKAPAVCSKKDVFNRKRGREIALGRLVKRQKTAMGLVLKEAYANRFPPMPQVQVRESIQ